MVIVCSCPHVSKQVMPRSQKAGRRGQKYGIPVYERVGFTEYSNFRDGKRNIDLNEYTAEEFIVLWLIQCDSNY